MGILVFVTAKGQRSSVIHNIGNWLKTENDSSYIEDHTQDLTVRLYGSRKYNYYDIVDRKQNQSILYRPNTPFNVGFGANYRFIGVNIGFNLPFINDTKKYGKTRSLDLQTHLYLRKLVVDFYGQTYKGYYIANSRGLLNGFTPGDPLPVRPDIRALTIGLSTQYIFNDRRFSYRAAYLQNEYQKKSAGSFLVGFDIFGSRMKGDSSLIPHNISKENFFNNVNFYRTGVFSFALSGGYGYTYVYKQHWFATAAVTLSGGVNYTVLNQVGAKNLSGAGFQWNDNVRLSAGYNSARYFAGIHYVELITRSNSPVDQAYQRIGAGNFRVSFVRRFGLKKPIPLPIVPPPTPEELELQKAQQEKEKQEQQQKDEEKEKQKKEEEEKKQPQIV
jgi:hypothetical protein